MTPIDRHHDDPDLIALDTALTELASGGPTGADPEMVALATLAHWVSDRASAIQARAATEQAAATGVAQPQTRPGRAVSHRSPGPRRAKLLVGVATAAAATLLVGLLPFNAAASSPLHPLHALFFDQADPAAEQTAMLLASSRQALDDANGHAGAQRDADVERARRLIDQARTHASQIADATTRVARQREVDELEERLHELGDDDTQDDERGADDTKAVEQGDEQGQENDQDQNNSSEIEHEGHGQSRGTASQTLVIAAIRAVSLASWPRTPD